MVENYKNHFKTVRQIINFFFKMMWQLMWRNIRTAALNGTFHLLVIYRGAFTLKFTDRYIAYIPFQA